MRIIPLLSQTIAALELPRNGYARPEGTRLITDTIVRTCRENNIFYEREVRIGLWREKKTKRQGIIDFLIKDEGVQFALEIDSTNKKWSLEKLQFIAAQGHQAIWVRWKSQIKLNIPPDIHFLDFTK